MLTRSRSGKLERGGLSAIISNLNEKAYVTITPHLKEYQEHDFSLKCLAVLYRVTDDPMMLVIFWIINISDSFGWFDSKSSLSPFSRSLLRISAASEIFVHFKISKHRASIFLTMSLIYHR